MSQRLLGMLGHRLKPNPLHHNIGPLLLGFIVNDSETQSFSLSAIKNQYVNILGLQNKSEVIDGMKVLKERVGLRVKGNPEQGHGETKAG